jgi:osmotically-inducible protein OsmY
MSVASLSAPTRLAPRRDLTTREADESLAYQVASAVRRVGIRAGRGVTILASEGQITLRGLTRSFYEKQLMLHATQQVDGVREIVDELDVLPMSPR